MKTLSKYTSRRQSILTGKNNLEHLHTQANMPVFFGCTDQPKTEDVYADMRWAIDPETGIIQLSDLIPLDILYMDQHVDAIGKTWQTHNESFSDFVLNITQGDLVEIGGGSGKLAETILSKNAQLNYTIVEPNPLAETRQRLKIIRSFFERTILHEKPNQSIVFSHVLEHIYDPRSFLNSISSALPVGGNLIFSYPQLELWFKRKYTNAINFEHTALLTDYYIDHLLKEAGFAISVKVGYGDHSHFYHAVKSTSQQPPTQTLENRYEHYKSLFLEYIDHHRTVADNLNALLNAKQRPAFLFGAHVFSQSLLTFGLRESAISQVLDNSPIKQGKRLYGTNLKVNSPKILSGLEKPIVILKAALHSEEIQHDILTNINSRTEFIL
jgi:2-polyprenyl-3-methyl-5-hydroxy-6-metoxy-1,4-benzoquinol methylase